MYEKPHPELTPRQEIATRQGRETPPEILKTARTLLGGDDELTAIAIRGANVESKDPDLKPAYQEASFTEDGKLLPEEVRNGRKAGNARLLGAEMDNQVSHVIAALNLATMLYVAKEKVDEKNPNLFLGYEVDEAEDDTNGADERHALRRRIENERNMKRKQVGEPTELDQLDLWDAPDSRGK